MPAEPAPRGPLSLWALASVLVSPCGIACPPLVLVGPVLGVVGLIQTGRGQRGRRLAIAGIATGLSLAAGWSIFGMWWHREVRVRLLEGPRTALVAGQAGDLAGFRAELTPAAAAAEDAEILAFIDAISSRYGRFRRAVPLPGPAGEEPVTPFSASYTLHYRLEFDQASVPATAAFVIRDGGSVNRWGSITIDDPDRGPLSFPPSPADNGDR